MALHVSILDPPSLVAKSQSVIVYTIGHSNHPLDKLTRLLQEHRIEVLVDIRSKPQSRWVPHFNQRNLETALPGIGIEYQYFGKELGGLPDNPTLYKRNANRKRKSDSATIADYGKIAQQNWFEDGINKLIEVAGEKRVTIMCSEEKPESCHRSLLVGQALMQKGVTVLHIRKDGALQPQSDRTTIA